MVGAGHTRLGVYSTEPYSTFFATGNVGPPFSFYLCVKLGLVAQERAPSLDVNITAGLFQKNLESQTHKVVTLACRWITLLFLAVQLIPFVLIGYAAYKDLKTHT